MTLGIGQLITAYVVLAAVLAGLNLFSSLSWWTKATLVVLTSVSYVVLYYSFAPLLGWPSSSDLPRRFSLLAVYGQEPDRITGAKGNIYFWVQDKTQGDLTPRAYVVDYDPELHARAKEARQRLQKNVPQIGESGDEMPDLMRMGIGKEQNQGAKAHKFTVKFFDAPSDAPPAKGDLPPPSTSDAPQAGIAPPQS